MMEQTCGLDTNLRAVVQYLRRSLQLDVNKLQLTLVRLVMDYLMEYLNMVAAYTVDTNKVVDYHKVSDQDFVKVMDLEYPNKPMEDAYPLYQEVVEFKYQEWHLQDLWYPRMVTHTYLMVLDEDNLAMVRCPNNNMGLAMAMGCMGLSGMTMDAVPHHSHHQHLDLEVLLTSSTRDRQQHHLHSNQHQNLNLKFNQNLNHLNQDLMLTLQQHRVGTQVWLWDQLRLLRQDWVRESTADLKAQRWLQPLRCWVDQYHLKEQQVLYPRMRWWRTSSLHLLEIRSLCLHGVGHPTHYVNGSEVYPTGRETIQFQSPNGEWNFYMRWMDQPGELLIQSHQRKCWPTKAIQPFFQHWCCDTNLTLKLQDQHPSMHSSTLVNELVEILLLRSLLQRNYSDKNVSYKLERRYLIG